MMKTITKLIAASLLNLAVLAPSAAQDNSVSNVLSGMIKQAIETASNEIESQIDRAISSVGKEMNAIGSELDMGKLAPSEAPLVHTPSIQGSTAQQKSIAQQKNIVQQKSIVQKMETKTLSINNSNPKSDE